MRRTPLRTEGTVFSLCDPPEGTARVTTEMNKFIIRKGDIDHGRRVWEKFCHAPCGAADLRAIIAVAQGQSELCRVYLDYLFELAFREGDPEKGINSVKFKLPRQIVTPEGDTKTVELEVEAPRCPWCLCRRLPWTKPRCSLPWRSKTSKPTRAAAPPPWTQWQNSLLGVQLQRDREGDHVP